MNYPIFDAHCDTISEIFGKNSSLNTNNLHIDIERMKNYPEYIQVFAAFLDKKNIKESPSGYVEKLISVYKREIAENGICHCETTEQIENAKYSSVLAIEGGEAIEGSLENLERFYSDGVRIITLTWNYRNEIADGITEKSGAGLTDFGKTVVRKMNALGMVVDVSHISEKGFWDVLNTSDRPIAATHSNVKTLCSHPRNLDDGQIKAIIENKGVIGMNFYPLFLDDFGRCAMERIVDHIEYILDMGGENNIGFGSDFDGVEYLPDGMTGIEDMEKLISIMENRGFGKNIIEKIAFRNFMRVLKANFV